MARVSVIATSAEGTRAALCVAAKLMAREPSELCVFVRSGQDAALPSTASSMRTSVFTYSGRFDELYHLVPKSAPLVLGGRAGMWLASPEQRLARRFTKLGYRVLLAPLPVTARYAILLECLRFLHGRGIDAWAMARSPSRSAERAFAVLAAFASAAVLALPPLPSLMLAVTVAILWCVWLDN